MTTVAATLWGALDNPNSFVRDKPVGDRGAPISATGSLRADDDLQLILRVAAKDQQAITILYQRYAPRLGRFLSKLLKSHEVVDEALNDTMLVVWRKASQFDPDRACLSTWLFGIARRAGLMGARAFGQRVCYTAPQRRGARSRRAREHR